MGIFDFVTNPKKALLDSLFPFVSEHLENGNAVNIVNLLKDEFVENCQDNESVEFLITIENDKDKDVIMINVVALNEVLEVRVLKQYRIDELLEMIKAKVNE